MRLLGLDYGSKTVGVAVTDPLGYTAQPLETIPIGLIITTWGDMKFDKWYEEQKEQWEEKKEREQEINPYVILE